MRKHSLPPEIAELSHEHLAELDSWLDRFTYAKVTQLFATKHGKSIGRGKLTRYYAHRAKAKTLSPIGQLAMSPVDLIAIQNGTPLPDPRLNVQILQRRAAELARSPIDSPFKLKELFDVCTYTQRQAFAERRLQIEERAEQLRVRRAVLRERELAYRRNTRRRMRRKPVTALLPHGQK